MQEWQVSETDDKPVVRGLLDESQEGLSLPRASLAMIQPVRVVVIMVFPDPSWLPVIVPRFWLLEIPLRGTGNSCGWAEHDRRA